MRELRDKRKNAGQIYYTRMDELRSEFSACEAGEIVMAAWDYEQFGIEYDFKNQKYEEYPNISENQAMQIEYRNLIRDFKLLEESYNESCEKRRENAKKRWNPDANSTTDETKTDAFDIAQQYKNMGVKSVRELKTQLERGGVHDSDTQTAIIEAFTKLQ